MEFCLSCEYFDINFWFPASPALQFLWKYGFTIWLENSVEPDQLASAEASWSGSPLFSKRYMSLAVRKPVFVGLLTTKAQTCASIWLAPLLLGYWKYYKLATSEFSIFWLVSVAKETCLSLALSETLKTGFVATRPMLCELCAYKFNYGTSENGTMFSIHMLEVKSSDKSVHKRILNRDITVWTCIVLNLK